jgi:hypothetical protein
MGTEKTEKSVVPNSRFRCLSCWSLQAREFYLIDPLEHLHPGPRRGVRDLLSRGGVHLGPQPEDDRAVGEHKREGRGAREG